MIEYIVRRILLAALVAIGAVTLVFVSARLTPGDPVDTLLGENATPSNREELRAALGLDKPIVIQYLSFLAGVARLDFGHSIMTKRAVADDLKRAYPYTFALALASMTIALVIAFALGLLAAAHENSVIDRALMTLSLLGVSTPSFWIGPLLIILFSVKLGWLPVSGAQEPASVILPAITLGTAMAAILARLIRSSVIETLKEDYILLARSKGFSRMKVICARAAPNALIPVVTVAGLQLGALLAGAMITETIFAWPGIGKLTVDAIMARDYPVAQGAVIALAISYALVNLLVDLLYGYFDPRARLFE